MLQVNQLLMFINNINDFTQILLLHLHLIEPQPLMACSFRLRNKNKKIQCKCPLHFLNI